MNSLTTRYSNLQVYGFFGLFLANSIWTYYGLFVLKTIFYSTNPTAELSSTMLLFGIYVTVPLSVSLIILFRMKSQKMISLTNYYFLLFAGFATSAVVSMTEHLILK